MQLEDKTKKFSIVTIKKEIIFEKIKDENRFEDPNDILQVIIS